MKTNEEIFSLCTTYLEHTCDNFRKEPQFQAFLNKMNQNFEFGTATKDILSPEEEV